MSDAKQTIEAPTPSKATSVAKSRPAPDPEPPPNPPPTLPQSPHRRFPWWSIPLWLLTFASITFNIVVLNELLTIRQAVRESIGQTAEVVESFQAETFSYNFTVEDVIDVNTDIPFQETIEVPIRDSIAINTSVAVPVNAGPLGSFNVTIPISTVIPIELDVPVEIDRTITIRAAVPIEVDVPVVIAIADTPLAEALTGLQTSLEGLEAELSQPIIFGIGGADD